MTDELFPTTRQEICVHCEGSGEVETPASIAARRNRMKRFGFELTPKFEMCQECYGNGDVDVELTLEERVNQIEAILEKGFHNG